ncbi:MAG TPA: tetratricopeptide repeat protein [Cyclobacteriaceae bacterium]|jgi:tetratricopeptide (TPR) repeat protein|nr:tetratricopeptide repeat protein [Cyclobacteriaceae bacterium]
MKYVLALSLFLCGLSLAAQDLKEANELIENFQFEKALAVLKPLPDTSDIHVSLQKGYCYARLGNYSEAMQSYQRALVIDSINKVALNQLGQVYAKTNRFDQAEMCYKKLIGIDSSNSFYFKQYAVLASSTNRDSIAGLFYKKALQLNPKDVESSISWGNILLEADNYFTIDSLVSQALMYDSLQRGVMLLRAKSLMAQHRYKETVAVVNKILQRNDPQAIHARLLGICYFQLKKYDNTIEWMNFLLLSGVKSEWVFYYLGASYQELGDIPKSIESMNKAIESGISDNIEIYYSQLAKSYEDAKDYKNAIRYYQAAYEKSKTKILLYHLARNYDVYFKDKSSAIAYYKRYLASDDTIKLARQYAKHRLRVLE